MRNLSQFELLQESLGIKHLNPDGRRRERKLKRIQGWRERDLKNSREKIIELKTLLKSLGYKIIKVEDRGAYTTRLSRIVALEKPNPKSSLNKTNYKDQLFTLAHEVGHVLQWDEDTDTKHMFKFFFERSYKSPIEEVEKFLETIFYELDAWDKGLRFIPKELLSGYYKDAKAALRTYLKLMPEGINLEDYDFLKPLVAKFLL